MQNQIHQRFLVIRTDRMGDVILSTPVLTALKKSFPDCRTTMMVRSYTKEIIEGHPDLDDIIIYDPEGSHKDWKGLMLLVNELRSQKFNTAILLHPKLRLALVCWLAGIPNRLGTAYRAYSFLLNHRVKIHRKNVSKHECDLNLELVQSIGAKLYPVEFKISIPQQAISKVENLLTESGIHRGDKFIVLHPGSGGSALDWPLEYFGKLAQKINVPLIITGVKGEKEKLDIVEKTAQKKLVRMDGLLNVKELAALLQKSSLTVANSTGPLHLADAVGSIVLGLFSPVKAHRPERWGPYTQPNSVILPPVAGCVECRKKCSYDNCMELISVEKVFERVQSLISD